ncbi:hypothetical protein [Massilia sp. TWP1-3-3]
MRIYAMLRRWLPAPLANLVMVLWYGALLLALWLAPAVGLGFRYGQI